MISLDSCHSWILSFARWFVACGQQWFLQGLLNGAAVRRWGRLGGGAYDGIGVHRSNGDGNLKGKKSFLEKEVVLGGSIRDLLGMVKTWPLILHRLSGPSNDRGMKRSRIESPGIPFFLLHVACPTRCNLIWFLSDPSFAGVFLVAGLPGLLTETFLVGPSGLRVVFSCILDEHEMKRTYLQSYTIVKVDG